MTGSYNPDLNIFMMCKSPCRAAMTDLPRGYSLRHIRPDELDFWKRLPFDGDETAEHMSFMDKYFDRVYAPQGDLFFQSCLFAVNGADEPVGTCFAWKAYGRFTTIHWFKVLPQYEGRGLGRALLSAVMRGLAPQDFPVYLHTQLGSFRAIKLYSDFGFKILKDEMIGRRSNDIDKCLPVLHRLMPPGEAEKLRFGYAERNFLNSVAEYKTDEF